MATRSTIAIEHQDGTVEQIYCHWDGYLDHNGRLLLEHWIDPVKVCQLISMGDLSVLGAVIGDEWSVIRAQHEPLTKFEEPCTFYGRDLKYKDTGPKQFKNFDDWWQNHTYQEYEYILRMDGKWYVQSYQTNNRLIELIEACNMQPAEDE